MLSRDFDPARLRALGFPEEPKIDAIVDSFLVRLVDDIGALDVNDRDEVKRLTHRLRGAAGSLGFPGIEDFLTSARITTNHPWRDEFKQLVENARNAYTTARTGP